MHNQADSDRSTSVIGDKVLTQEICSARSARSYTASDWASPVWQYIGDQYVGDSLLNLIRLRSQGQLHGGCCNCLLADTQRQEDRPISRVKSSFASQLSRKFCLSRGEFSRFSAGRRAFRADAAASSVTATETTEQRQLQQLPPISSVQSSRSLISIFPTSRDGTSDAARSPRECGEKGRERRMMLQPVGAWDACIL